MTYLVHGPEYKFSIATQRYAIVDPRRVAIHPTNPKSHDLGAITESIGENSFIGNIILLEQPLVMFDIPLPEDKDHWVVVGAGRTKSAIALGATEIPAIIADLDAETAEAMLLADNEAARRGSYDEAKLLAAFTSRIAKAEGDAIAGLRGTLFTGDDVDDVISRMKSAEAAAAQSASPFATFDKGKTPIDPTKFVAFHFGDHHGHVSRVLYEQFVARYSELRRGGATTNASGAAMMDDVLRAWLSL